MVFYEAVANDKVQLFLIGTTQPRLYWQRRAALQPEFFGSARFRALISHILKVTLKKASKQRSRDPFYIFCGATCLRIRGEEVRLRRYHPTLTEVSLTRWARFLYGRLPPRGSRRQAGELGGRMAGWPASSSKGAQLQPVANTRKPDRPEARGPRVTGQLALTTGEASIINR